jgi:hypothetical protein
MGIIGKKRQCSGATCPQESDPDIPRSGRHRPCRRRAARSRHGSDQQPGARTPLEELVLESLDGHRQAENDQHDRDRATRERARRGRRPRRRGFETRASCVLPVVPEALHSISHPIEPAGDLLLEVPKAVLHTRDSGIRSWPFERTRPVLKSQHDRVSPTATRHPRVCASRAFPLSPAGRAGGGTGRIKESDGGGRSLASGAGPPGAARMPRRSSSVRAQASLSFSSCLT